MDHSSSTAEQLGSEWPHWMHRVERDDGDALYEAIASDYQAAGGTASAKIEIRARINEGDLVCVQ